MPFYFQAALNESPLRSGIQYMSLAVPQMIGLFAGGGITTVTGHYVSSEALDSYRKQKLTYSQDARNPLCSSIVWDRGRTPDHPPHLHDYSTLGDLHGLDRSWSWSGCQCTTYCNSSRHEDVSEFYLKIACSS